MALRLVLPYLPADCESLSGTSGLCSSCCCIAVDLSCSVSGSRCCIVLSGFFSAAVRSPRNNKLIRVFLVFVIVVITVAVVVIVVVIVAVAVVVVVIIVALAL